MVAMIVLLLVSFLLYFFSAFAGYMTGANDDPSSKIRMVVGEDGELIQSDSNAADTFQKI